MKITKEIWGRTPEGNDIHRYTLENSKGCFVRLCDVGAAIVSIGVPDRDGKVADVVLGYPDPLSYFADGPCSGKVPGRFANRIAKGKFTLDGKDYTLPINNGPNHLHGGPQGFQNQVWESRIAGDAVEFLYFSADGEAGYPGNLKAVGEGSGTVLDHQLQLNASVYLPTDETLIPLGEPDPVAGTPMDFLEPKTIGRDIQEDFPALKYGKGYDNCFLIDGWEAGQLQSAATLYSPESGRALEVLTTQPAVQIYTGNWLAGCPRAKCGRSYFDYEGVAIECQHCPDSPNKPEYPTTVLRPGEIYEEAIIFAFSVR